MTILVKKVFISSKPTFVYLLCPPLCGPFSIQESAAGGLSYKEIKERTIIALSFADFLLGCISFLLRSHYQEYNSSDFSKSSGCFIFPIRFQMESLSREAVFIWFTNTYLVPSTTTSMLFFPILLALWIISICGNNRSQPLLYCRRYPDVFFSRYACVYCAVESMTFAISS